MWFASCWLSFDVLNFGTWTLFVVVGLAGEKMRLRKALSGLVGLALLLGLKPWSLLFSPC